MFGSIRRLMTFILMFTSFLIIIYSLQTSIGLVTQQNAPHQYGITGLSSTVNQIYPVLFQDNNLGYATESDLIFSTIPDVSRIKFFLLFIGYPRSGSTLLGSLLDAHQHIIIANEYNLLSKWKTFSSEQKNRKYVYSQLLNSSVSESKIRGQRAKRNKHFFNYHVPGLWQGKYKNHVEIFGDKKSTTTTRSLSNNGSYMRFTELISTLNVRVKFLHLIRNPFDNIATMTLRSHSGLRMKAETEDLQMNNRETLWRQTQIYLKLVDMNAKLRKQFGRDVLDVHYSSFVQQPKLWLKTICDFLEISCSTHYLNSCVSIIFKKETYTRRHIVWPEDIKEIVLDKIDKMDFLSGLKFEIT